ncbi:MAG: phosphoenolpyruvate--protein phosphotransferase, partial [Thermodesulfobacteriota bacterium]
NMSSGNLINRADFHLKIVQEISDLVNKSTGLNTILKKVVNKIGVSLHFDVVSVYIWDETEKHLYLRSTKGLSVNPLKDPITLKPNEGLTGLVFETSRPLTVMPASQHSRYKYFPEIGEEEYESYIGVPILLQNRCIGVLVGQTKDKRAINPAEEMLFEIIASRLAGLLEVADRLERLKTPSIVKHETRTYQGKGVSIGIAIGNVFLFRGLFQQISSEESEKSNPKVEKKRVLKALSDVEADLEKLIQTLNKEKLLSKAEIEIFRAHLLVIQGKTLRNTMFEKLDQKNISAELAVVEAVEDIAEQFESLTDRYLREKAQDFRDIGERILHELLKLKKGHSHAAEPEEGSILVANDIGPSFISMLFKNTVSAVVIEKGGETSHAVIIAKSLGIPAVVGIDNICNLIRPGEKLIVDGKTGFIFSNPDETLISEYKNSYANIIKVREVIDREGNQNAGEKALGVKLTANIGFPIDIQAAKLYGINDVGLFRTEFAFTQYTKWPKVREQLRIYKNLAMNFEGYITVRTLDIGADKLLPYFDFPKEENPLLGLRAIRFSMEYLDLFKDQIKAILLATKKGFKFKIMLPMVTNLWEVETAKEIIEDLAKEIGIASVDLPKLGVMMEVPSMIYQLDDYNDLIDFMSIGTNDLIQYLLAVDRNSNMVGHLYSAYHPAVLRLLNEVNLKSHYLGMDVSVCGELAGTPSGALSLLSLGYNQLSVSPSNVPTIRYLCNRIDKDLLNDVRHKILNIRKKSEIERYMIETLESIDPALIEIE